MTRPERLYGIWATDAALPGGGEFLRLWGGHAVRNGATVHPLACFTDAGAAASRAGDFADEVERCTGKRPAVSVELLTPEGRTS